MLNWASGSGEDDIIDKQTNGRSDIRRTKDDQKNSLKFSAKVSLNETFMTIIYEINTFTYVVFPNVEV